MSYLSYIVSKLVQECSISNISHMFIFSVWVRTCSELPLKGLADVTLTDRAILTLVNNMNIYEKGREKLLQDLNKARLIYASKQEKLLQDFNKAMLYYVSAEEELARELKRFFVRTYQWNSWFNISPLARKKALSIALTREKHVV